MSVTKNNQCDICVTCRTIGKVGFNTVEHITAFQCSDWLYFLRHGVKTRILLCGRSSIKIQRQNNSEARQYEHLKLNT